MSQSISSSRSLCLDIFKTGIDAADPWDAVKGAISVNDEGHIGLLGAENGFRWGNWSGIHVIAFGKAAITMARSALSILPSDRRLNKALVVTNYENASAAQANPYPCDEEMEIMAAGHPVPDRNGAKAAEVILSRLEETKPGQLVLILVSGGGSALLPAPAGDMALDDKIAVTQALLESGASINDVNMVRKHLSRIKGGQMAAAAAPADIHSFILSDVIGDDLSAIASGPTVPDPGTFQACFDSLKHHDLLDTIPAVALNHIQAGLDGFIADTPKADHACFTRSDYALIGSNGLSVSAMEKAILNAGLRVERPATALVGEARDAAESLAHWAARWFDTAKTGQSILLATGGETTVTIRGNGRGGRNQEMALAFAIFAEKLELPDSWVFLSGGTDGRDGPTDAAGGLVDPSILGAMRTKSIYPNAILENNDSYSALKEVNGLIMIGATGTNVADLQLLHLWKDG